MNTSISHRYFSREGRIRRVEYLIRVLILMGIGFVLGFLNILLTTIHQFPPITLVFHIVLIVALTISQIMIMIKRQHDINLSAWYALLLLVPIVGLIWPIALLFIAGKTNTDYGEPNSG